MFTLKEHYLALFTKVCFINNQNSEHQKIQIAEAATDLLLEAKHLGSGGVTCR